MSSGESGSILIPQQINGPMENTMARRRYQKGQLFLRGKTNPVWVGRWREDVASPSGGIKRVYRSLVLGDQTAFPTKRLAQRELDKRLAEVNSLDYRPKRAVLFSQFAEVWEKEVLPQYKKSYQVQAKSVLRSKLLPFFGNQQLWAIRPVDVQRFITSANLAPSTIKGIYGTLRGIWKVARAWGYVDHDPFQGVRLPHRTPTERQPFTQEELMQILTAAPEPKKTLYWLAAETAMRIGELLALKVENVDFERRLLHVRASCFRGEIGAPKSKSGLRTIALSTPLAEHLRQYEGKTGFMFTTSRGNPLDYSTELYSLHGLLAKLGIAKRGFHAFRYTSATIAASGGASVKTLQARLGHADANMTLVYERPLQADDRLIAERLGQMIAPNLHPAAA